MATKGKEGPSASKARGHHRSEPEPFSQALGAKIRELRQDRDISFDAVVGTSGLGRGYVSEVERGLAVPSVITLCRLAEALEVSPVDLLNDLCLDRPARTRLTALSEKLTDADLATLVELAEEMLKRSTSE